MAVFAPIPSASVSTATAAKLGFLANWRKANFKSFISKGDHGMNLCRAASRQPAGSAGYTNKTNARAGKGQRVHGVDAIQLASQKARETRRADNANNNAEKRRP